MKVILINGKSRMGKNTVSSILLSNLVAKNHKCFELGNADAVKDQAKDFFMWNGQKDDKGKQLLINVTDTGYNYDPYFWEKKSFERINQLNKMMIVKIEYLLVPDWRYKCTYDFWCDKVGQDNVITLKVERPNFDSGLADNIKNDKSENLDFNFDSVIINDGTIEDLKKKLSVMGF